MKTLSRLALGLLLVSNIAWGELRAGAEIHFLNFFIVPSSSPDVTTKTNFGLGSAFIGYSLGEVVGVDAVISYDNTGTLSSTTSMLGVTGTISGKFKVFTIGAQITVDPPFFPLYLRAGIGFGSLSSAFVTTPVTTDPFDQAKMSFAAHFGVGLSFNATKYLKIFGGLDGVFVKINPNGSALNITGFPFFRSIAGVSIPI